MGSAGGRSVASADGKMGALAESIWVQVPRSSYPPMGFFVERVRSILCCAEPTRLSLLGQYCICRMTEESRAFFSGIVLLVNADVEAVEPRCVFVCVLDGL